MQLANYLFFTTMCEQALDFYTRCGLGKVTTLVRYGDNGMPCRTKPFAARSCIRASRARGCCFTPPTTTTPSRCAVRPTFS